VNTHPFAKRVLIYGDSFTYWRMTWQWRYASNKRFTWSMQDILWLDYEIIEEGLRGRTVAWENSFFPHRDWLDQFDWILGSHLPVDVLIFFLWTNDCNAWFDKTPEDFQKSYEKYARSITQRVDFFWIQPPKVILVSPPVVKEQSLPDMFKPFFVWATAKAEQLRNIYESIALHHGWWFFDAELVVSASDIDGIHIDEQGHQTLAKHLTTYMLSMSLK